MAAVQEPVRARSRDKEACVPQWAANQGVKPISLRIPGVSYTDKPNRVWGVGRMRLDSVGRLKHEW
jgi:hypothetical protein